MTELKMLDCFCGLGGASMGFAKEGFDCTGIDVVNVGYPYRFILADMHSLKGEDYRGYDVIWGSPPCRDFSPLGRLYGMKWKRKPSPQYGLKLVNAFLKFVEEAQPKFWIMENVENLKNYLLLKPKIVTKVRHKAHCFWGDFPLGLYPRVIGNPMGVRQVKNGESYFQSPPNIDRKLQPWINAKIPLACSQAFARACKDVLLEKELTV